MGLLYIIALRYFIHVTHPYTHIKIWVKHYRFTVMTAKQSRSIDPHFNAGIIHNHITPKSGVAHQINKSTTELFRLLFYICCKIRQNRHHLFSLFSSSRNLYHRRIDFFHGTRYFLCCNSLLF